MIAISGSTEAFCRSSAMANGPARPLLAADLFRTAESMGFLGLLEGLADKPSVLGFSFGRLPARISRFRKKDWRSDKAKGKPGVRTPGNCESRKLGRRTLILTLLLLLRTTTTTTSIRIYHVLFSGFGFRRLPCLRFSLKGLGHGAPCPSTGSCHRV